MQQVIKENPDKQETIGRTEIAFYSYTQKPQKTAQPDLFQLYGYQLINLAILLDDEATSNHTIVDFPTNVDDFKILNSGKHQEPTGPGLKVSQFCIVVWQNCDAR